MLNARQDLRPPIFSVLNEKGVGVDYIKLISMTTKSIFEYVLKNSRITHSAMYRMQFKDGSDGAGSQSVWKSKSMIGAKHHMYQYALVPLKLECCVEHDDETSHMSYVPIWKNPKPNSPLWVRPVYLIREKEDDEELKKYVTMITDECRTKLQAESMVIETGDKQAFNVQFQIHNTMMDLKLKRNLCGKGGADCILCKHPQKEWMDSEIISEGFKISTSASETLKTYEALIEKGQGEIAKEACDYTERQGITQKPTTTSNLHCIAITHSWINTTNWFFKVLSRMNAEDETWVEKENCYGDHIRAGTFRVREIIYQETGKSLMQVAGALSKSGGSTDGNDGREFFTLAFLPIILKCIPEKYHDTIKKLHRDLSCILRVISSTSKVNWHAFEKLTQEASILLANELSWVRVNWTLHGVLHHSCELIRMNEQCGLGMLSEEALEANNNKYICAKIFRNKS